MTDYAIARRIVDLHARNVESVERVYATEDIQRYILFARQFQPKVCAGVQQFAQIADFELSHNVLWGFWFVCVFLFIFFKITPEAQEFVVEQYKRLRQRDGGGATKSAWRITVRQLESMLRLSEAMARLYCSDEVRKPALHFFCTMPPDIITRGF